MSGRIETAINDLSKVDFLLYLIGIFLKCFDITVNEKNIKIYTKILEKAFIIAPKITEIWYTLFVQILD